MKMESFGSQTNMMQYGSGIWVYSENLKDELGHDKIEEGFELHAQAIDPL